MNKQERDELRKFCKIHINGYTEWILALLDRLDAYESVVEAARKLEPHLDKLVCYASTTSEHEPNKLVANMVKALEGLEDED